MIQQRKKVDGTYKMPFGKHKGEFLQDIPTDYLAWLSETLEPGKYNNDAVLAEIENQIKLRDGEGVSREPEKKPVVFKLRGKDE